MYEIIYKLLMKAAWYSSYVDVLQIVKKKTTKRGASQNEYLYQP